MRNDELMHYGVLGMKWGQHKARDKSSFNTTYRHTMLDQRGRMVGEGADGVTKHQRNKAERSARREANAYRKAYGSRARSKDELSVMGNKYDSEIARYRASNKNAHNKNYSDTQRKNDRALYGQRGEKRINKKLNEGYGLRGARHFEVERRERTEKRKKSIKKAASRIGTAYVIDKYFNGGAGARLVGSLAGSAVYNGRKAAKRMMQYYWDTHPDIL